MVFLPSVLPRLQFSRDTLLFCRLGWFCDLDHDIYVDQLQYSSRVLTKREALGNFCYYRLAGNNIWKRANIIYLTRCVVIQYIHTQQCHVVHIQRGAVAL